MIASKYVISAAHCMYKKNNRGKITGGYQPEEIVISIGDHHLGRRDGEAEKFIHVKAITIHEEYNGQEADGWDIALLELVEELDLDTYTPACLAKSTDLTTFDNKTATIAGWGHIRRWGRVIETEVPHEVQVTVAPKCHWIWNEIWQVDSNPSIMCLRTWRPNLRKGEEKGACSVNQIKQKHFSDII